EVPDLVDTGGRFGENPVRVGVRYFCSPRARRQLAAEIGAQFARFAATGLPLSHVDAHLHFQLHPVVFPMALAGARGAACYRIRIPLDSWSAHCRIDPVDAWKQAPLAAVFAGGCARLRRRARAAGFCFPRFVLGLFRTGRLDAAYLSTLMRVLP